MRTSYLPSLRTRLLLAAGALTAAALNGAARADTPPETVCIDPDKGGTCPGGFDAYERIEEADPGRCPSVTDDPGALMDGKCCYEVRYDCSTQVVGCNVSGRPLLIEGKAVRGDSQRALGWGRPDTKMPDLYGLTAEERRLLAVHWARIGAAEHASIAGFSRFAMDLLACGAPAELLAGAQRAALDEIRHAELAFSLASAFAGAPIGPAPLDMPGAVPIHRSLLELAVATAEEGCTVETLSACLLAEAHDRAEDPAVKEALARMRRDEDRHAALSWQALAWALGREPSIAPAVREALAAAIAGLRTEGFARAAGLERYGLLRPWQADACRRAAVEQIIVPCARAIAGLG